MNQQNKISKIFIIATGVLPMLAFTGLLSHAQSVPNLINYQGRLTDQTGAGLPPGQYQIQFRLWDSPTATNNSDLIWGQQQTLTVQPTGVFATILGSGGTAIPSTTPAVNDLSFAFTQSSRYIGLTVISSNGIAISGASEILPRQQILSVPYAVTASFASTAQNAINGVSAGSVMPFAGAVAPSGWLLCNGAAVSRTTYSNLFTVIGISNGNGDGATTFNLPDYRGRTLMGMDATQVEFSSLGETGGAKTHTNTVAELAAHSHIVDNNQNNYGGGGPNAGFGATGNRIWSGSTGGSQPYNILPPYSVVNYIIKW